MPDKQLILTIPELIACPFCGDVDFDLIGLKRHLLNGWCECFNEVDIYIPQHIITDNQKILL
jgi:4-hydroxy-3-methylbut-2-en-1-yl diphosphate synthase IspG/GcpE